MKIRIVNRGAKYRQWMGTSKDMEIPGEFIDFLNAAFNHLGYFFEESFDNEELEG